jgi:pre-mRNA-processing factor 17
MDSILALGSYGGSDSDESDSGINEAALVKQPEHLKVIKSRLAGDKTTLKMEIVAAPTVITKYDVAGARHVDTTGGEVVFNPTVEELYKPQQGPDAPNKTHQSKAMRNMLSGYAEKEHISDFAFETQRKTYHSYGYAQDPSKPIDEEDMHQEEKQVISRVGVDENAVGLNIWQTGQKRKRRKKDRADDPSDIEGWKGPWARFKDEKTNEELAASGEIRAEMDEILEKRRAKKALRRANRDEEEVDVTNETTTLHINDPNDYLGRNYLHPPQDEAVNLNKAARPARCFLPKKLIHTYKGHSKGVTTIELFPTSGHLVLSASMDGEVKIWETYGKRRMLRTYSGHNKGVRTLDFSRDGKQFITGSYDRFIKLWDTETGQCVTKLTNRKIPYCLKFNPDENRQHLFLAGCNDKKVSCWDTRSGNICQQYDRHLNPVNTITFIDNNRRFVTTSDDKSVRVWEWDIPVDFKYIADPGMHSMPAVTKSPDEKYLAATSLDNKICVFDCTNGKFRPKKKKEFKGHVIAGYACRPCFSPDQSYLCSGDGEGKMFIWDWKNGRLYSRFRAHDQVVIDCKWLPHETSKENFNNHIKI